MISFIENKQIADDFFELWFFKLKETYKGHKNENLD